MIPKVCGSCEQQVLEKRASFYWAWVNADGRRRAYKQMLCATCVIERFSRVIVASLEPVLMCPKCGISTVDDYDAVYLTYCLPGMPKQQSEMPLCGVCAVEVRTEALKGATPLADREARAGGLSPQPTDPAPDWGAMGLRPRS
jgi:hypothetical protein